MRILLLSAYDAQSHQYWRKGLESHLGEHQWTVLTLPARHFSWRIRGNSLSWALAQHTTLNQPYDLVFATSMVDLATLRGLVPALAGVPSLLYFHENQFFYPRSERQHKSVEPQMVSLYSALAADRLLFNSQHNRDTFFDGVDALLARLPDCVPPGVSRRLAEKAAVLPVPINPIKAGERGAGEHFQVVWNHRREYDKGPELLLNVMRALPAGLPLRVHILGQEFRRQPTVFNSLQQLLSDRGWLGQWGYLKEVQGYHRLLGCCEAVLSTALHDFQGLAVLEAVSAGCVPVVPDRLAYREWFDEPYRYDGGADEAGAAAAAITALVECWQAGEPAVAPSVKQLEWSYLAEAYRRELAGVKSLLHP